MDEDDIVKTQAEEIDALLAQQEEEIEFHEESEESSTYSEEEEPDLTTEGPEELVQTIATRCGRHYAKPRTGTNGANDNKHDDFQERELF